MNFKFVFDYDEDFDPGYMDYIINYHDSNKMRFKFWDNGFIPVNWYSNVAIDLLYISMSVFAADRLCVRDSAIDGWCRELKLYIPVLEKDIWIRNKILLEKTLNFLSGDNWIVEFRAREKTDKEIQCESKWEKVKNEAKKYTQVSMFSGGLDSFIGAIDLLETKRQNENILFVSHYGGGKGTIEYQNKLIERFVPKYNVKKIFGNFTRL